MRKIRTPGSAGGDGHKASCRFGEGTVPKGAATARLRYGYHAEARPYPPKITTGLCPPPRGGTVAPVKANAVRDRRPGASILNVVSDQPRA